MPLRTAPGIVSEFEEYETQRNLSDTERSAEYSGAR